MRGVVAAIVLGALFLLGGKASAEETHSASADPPSAGDNAPAGEVAEARRELEGTLQQMRAVAVGVRDDLRVTRKFGTKMQIACVDQALSRADVATRRARETGDEALAAYGRGDVDLARAARRRLAEIRETQRVAARDGATCSARRTSVAPSSAGTTVRMAVDPRVDRAP